jgi:Protein of unknown function (DUF1631)
MAQSPLGNVVPLGDHPRAKARLSRKESDDMLAGCRELARQRMVGALSGMLDRIEDDLFELAEKAVDRETQNLYLDARAQAREKRAVIEAAFGRHFVDFFNRKVRGEGEKPVAERASGELSLVGDEDLEEAIAVREMSQKIKESCEGELMALSQRMGFLLEKPELEDDANPMSPATVCAALRDACDQIQAGFKVRMTLMRQFEQYAHEELHNIYHDLNSHLVERRILPDILPGVRRPPSQPRRPRAASPKPATASNATAAPAAPRAEGDILGALAELLSGGAPAGAAPSGFAGGSGDAGVSAAGMAALVGGAPVPAGSAPGSAWPTAPGSAQAAPTVPSSFVTELTRMHREVEVHREIETGDGIPGEALMNVVRRIKSAPQSASLGTIDAMTIDIVAMLFDYIFDDRQIPSSVKALLGRLQIPLLKVALIDKSFFSSKAHPARRLLDLLAESSIGLADSPGDRQAAALKMIEEVVDKVLTEFETDVSLFEGLAARVEAFIDAQKRAENDIVERSAKLIEERERDEIARVIAAQEIARRLEARAWAPGAVREMLEDAWVGALASAQRTDGEGSPPWHGLLRTMDDLLWSVEPKASADDRKRLITILPGMLRELNEGMDRAAYPEESRTAFLGALVDCHAHAVKAGLRGLAALPESRPELPKREAEIARKVIPAGDIQVEEIRLSAPPGAAPVRNVFTRTGVWTNLKRGTWVAFMLDGATAETRARLTWISPNKGVYLFTNPYSAKSAVSISPEALAEQMRLGHARIIDDAPLVERAVDSMLTNLREAQG